MISADIIQTLKYSDHFNFPLTLKEIYHRLISSKKISIERISLTLDSMTKKHIISKSDDFYHFPSRALLVVKRKKNARESSQLTKRARAIALKLGKTRGVLAIYLTGSLAMANSDRNADIDFMIITANNRLWTTRFALTIYTELLGLRRHPQSKNSSGKVCLNLYLSPLSYALPNHKQSLYTAYELIQAIPLYDPHNTHSDLLLANSWIHDYLPNFILPVAKRSDLVGCKPNQKPTRSDLAGIFESLLYHLQLIYMRPKITREYITKDSAFFHPNDPAPRGLSSLQV